jgi:uncharacterized protein (DUF58 family)
MTVKVPLYTGLVGALLFVSLLAGRPDLVGVAAPFAVALVVGLALAERPVVQARLDMARDRVLEGEAVEVEIRVESSVAIARLELAVGLSEALTPTDGRRVQVVSVTGGAPVVVGSTIEPSRWGAHWVGPVAFRAHDVAGLCVFEGVGDDRRPLRVYPWAETLTALVPPAETQVLAGNRRARVLGEGIEFAELRPFVPGDRVREVNWRVAARGGGLWVNERHPERNSDVVVFLDTFSDALLGRAVPAAAALVAAYGGERDRVGLVDFGGSLRWVQPGSGLGHLYRVTEALIDTRVYVSYAWRGIGAVPTRTLPTKALVLAISPLEDERAVAALADLRRRGIDLAIIEVAPEVVAGKGQAGLDSLGHRVWLLEREVRRIQFRRLGVPVVEWTDGRPLAGVLEEVNAFRRRARRRAG